MSRPQGRTSMAPTTSTEAGGAGGGRPVEAGPPAVPRAGRRGILATPLPSPGCSCSPWSARRRPGAIVAGLVSSARASRTPRAARGAKMECMRPPEAAAFPGRARLHRRRLAGGVGDGRHEDRKHGPAGEPARAWLRGAGCDSQRWPPLHDRGPADGATGGGACPTWPMPEWERERSPTLGRRPGRHRPEAGAQAFETAVAPHWSSLVRAWSSCSATGPRRGRRPGRLPAGVPVVGRFQGPDVRAWLYTIALRLAFNEQRRHRRWLAAIRRIEPKPWTGPSIPTSGPRWRGSTSAPAPPSSSTPSTATASARSRRCWQCPRGRWRAGCRGVVGAAVRPGREAGS